MHQRTKVIHFRCCTMNMCLDKNNVFLQVTECVGGGTPWYCSQHSSTTVIRTNCLTGLLAQFVNTHKTVSLRISHSRGNIEMWPWRLFGWHQITPGHLQLCGHILITLPMALGTHGGSAEESQHFSYFNCMVESMGSLTILWRAKMVYNIY